MVSIYSLSNMSHTSTVHTIALQVNHQIKCWSLGSATAAFFVEKSFTSALAFPLVWYNLNFVFWIFISWNFFKHIIRIKIILLDLPWVLVFGFTSTASYSFYFFSDCWEISVLLISNLYITNFKLLLISLFDSCKLLRSARLSQVAVCTVHRTPFNLPVCPQLICWRQDIFWPMTGQFRKSELKGL